jgi:hypothetical protein
VIPIRPIPWRGAQGLFNVELPAEGLEFLEPANKTDAGLAVYLPPQISEYVGQVVEQVAQFAEQAAEQVAQFAEYLKQVAE